MKTNFKKITFLLLLLSALPLRSLANSDNDTILNYAYANGEIKLMSGNGELYQFAHDKDGYKYIYYLFTKAEYLHLEQTDVEDNNSHYCLDTQDASVAVWYNSATKKISAPDVKWSLRYEGEDKSFTKYVKDNPNKCLWWKDADKPVRLLFNVDNNREKKADSTTVLLYLMPPFSEKAKPDKLMQGNEDIKLNYGNKLGKSLNDFKNDTVFNKKIVTLNGVEYVFTRSDRAVVDSIIANGIVIPVEDNPGGPRQIVAKLDNIPIEREKDVNIKIHYRYFDRDGKLKPMTDSRYLPIHWERAKWWGVLLTIFAILVLIIVFTFAIKVLYMKKKNLNMMKKEYPQEETTEFLPDESQETESMPKEQPKLNRFFTDYPAPDPSPTEPTDHETTLKEQLKKLIFDIGKEEEELKSLRNELIETKQELQKTEQKLNQANAETEKAKAASAKAIEEAQAAAKAEFERKETDLMEKLEVVLKAQKVTEDILKDAKKKFDEKAKELEENCQTQVAAAQQAQKEAEQARDEAEQKAREEFEKQKKAIEAECDKMVKAAQDAEQQAKNEKQAALQEMQKQCDEALKQWTANRDAMLKMKVEAEERFHTMEDHYHKELKKLQAEIERLKIPTQTAIDKAMFISKCNDLLEEIERIRTTMKGKPELAELDDKLRNLEKIVIIKKQ